MARSSGVSVSSFMRAMRSLQRRRHACAHLLERTCRMQGIDGGAACLEYWRRSTTQLSGLPPALWCSTQKFCSSHPGKGTKHESASLMASCSSAQHDGVFTALTASAGLMNLISSPRACR